MRFPTHFRKGALTIALASVSASAFAETSPQDLEALQQRVNQLEERLEAAATTREQGGDNKTTVGGYGELHYNNWDNKSAGGSDKREIDFHRFVLFFGHEFDARTRFFAELELEHSFIEDTDTGSTHGEVELEQAFVEFDLNDAMTARGGLFLLPVGIINETHEPPAFYGVERNPVENKIVPSTWWEAGGGFTHRFSNGLSYAGPPLRPLCP